jgi:hypothetical protein
LLRRLRNRDHRHDAVALEAIHHQHREVVDTAFVAGGFHLLVLLHLPLLRAQVIERTEVQDPRLPALELDTGEEVRLALPFDLDRPDARHAPGDLLPTLHSGPRSLAAALLLTRLAAGPVRLLEAPAVSPLLGPRLLLRAGRLLGAGRIRARGFVAFCLRAGRLHLLRSRERGRCDEAGQREARKDPSSLHG